MKRATLNISSTLILVLLFLGSCTTSNKPIAFDMYFTVEHKVGYAKKSQWAYINIADLKEKYGHVNLGKFQILDKRNDARVKSYLIDSDNNNKADHIGFEMNIDSREPLRLFKIEFSDETDDTQILSADTKQGLKTSFLYNVPENSISNIDWPDKVATTFMNLYPEACELECFSPHKWTYTNGFFTNALCQLSNQTGNNAYIEYAQKWMDCFVDENGEIEKYVQEKYRLDDVLPARTLLYLYEKTGLEKYKIAANNFIHHIENQPKTTDGGYWHKKKYAHQMWLDGIYMGDVYSAQYAQMYNKPELFDEAAHQIKTIFKHTYDPNTGLMYHGWDESINDVWSHPEKGTSPEFWGRGMGWYMMALVDVLEYLPKDHKNREEIISILNKVSEGLLKYQDANSHLWYQVLDKGNAKGNWIETSCAAMFAYAFIKGEKNGYLPSKFKTSGVNAFNSLIKDYVLFDSANNFYLIETVKVGTLNFKNSDGSYEYYINVDRRINDFKGVAAFFYLTMEL